MMISFKQFAAVILQCDNTTVTSNSETDCLIAAATVKGYAAIRSQSNGR